MQARNAYGHGTCIRGRRPLPGCPGREAETRKKALGARIRGPR
jgi:hypothetical protein